MSIINYISVIMIFCGEPEQPQEKTEVEKFIEQKCPEGYFQKSEELIECKQSAAKEFSDQQEEKRKEEEKKNKEIELGQKNNPFLDDGSLDWNKICSFNASNFEEFGICKQNPEKFFSNRKMEVPPTSSIKDDEKPINIDRSDLNAMKYWQKQEKKLVYLTAGFGTIWAVSTVVATVLQSLIIYQASRCDFNIKEINNSGYLSNVSGSCSDAVDNIVKMAIPTYVMWSAAVGSGVGFVATGIVLGVHRSHKPQPRLSLGTTKLKINF